MMMTDAFCDELCKVAAAPGALVASKGAGYLTRKLRQIARAASKRGAKIQRMTMGKKAGLLSAQGRKHIKGKNFAIPEAKKYPIHDLAHARNALARVAQHGTPQEQARVRAAVYAKYPGLRSRAQGATR